MDKTVTKLNREDVFALPTHGMAKALATGGMKSGGAMWLSGLLTLRGNRYFGFWLREGCGNVGVLRVGAAGAVQNERPRSEFCEAPCALTTIGKLTWLALGGDPAARSRRVEQFTAL